MAVLESIKKRYSVRSYKAKPVETEKLNNILEAARIAPSAKNMQEWRFVVVRDPGIIKQLVPAANNQAFVGQAPVVIAGCAVLTDYVMRCGQTAYPIDLAIAMEHIALQAAEEGLGTCWIGSFFEDQVKKILQIPENVKIVDIMTLGYPADTQTSRKREPLEKIVSYDKWSF